MSTRYFISCVFFLIFIHGTYAQSPVFNWAVRIGAATTTSAGFAIANDAAGNVYTAGRFSGTIDFDPGAGVVNLTAAGANDAFILKLDASGNFVWAKSISGTGDEWCDAIILDGSGAIYTTGHFTLTADFDPGAGVINLTSAGSQDAFILKLDANGNFVWAKKWGGTGLDTGRSIAASSSGNVYTTGAFEGTSDFDPGAGTFTLSSVSGTADIFISKLDVAGNFVWAKSMGGTSFSDAGESITVDAAENVYTTGSFSATVDFDPGTTSFNLTTAGNDDFFISKLDVSGNFVWAKRTGGTGEDLSERIQLDALGNVYTSGGFDGTVDFDPGAGTTNLTAANASGLTDAFISKLDNNGVFVWAKRIGGSGNEYASSIAIDATGNSYVTGEFSSATDFDPGAGTFTISPVASDDAYVLQLDPSGNFIGAQAIGGSGSQIAHDITVSISGSVYTTGFFSGTADFDPGTTTSNLTAVGVNDIFIQKTSPLTTITGLSPASGPIGTTVSISGTGFGTAAASNIVFFGATKATVTAATATQLTVTVPAGATYQPISVLVNGLTAYSGKPFIVTFADGGVIDACAFAAKVDVPAGSQPYSIAMGDLDSDGKPDLAVANSAGNTVSVFKNTSSRGTINASSFASAISFATNLKPYAVAIMDLDGDGKPELIVTNNDSDNVSVYKNTTVTGVLNASSFAAKVDFNTGENPWNMTIHDFDLDGKPDIAVVNDVSNTISVLKNTSASATINTSSFAAKVDFATGNFPIGIASGDLDGDTKIDLVVTNQTDNSISVFRNTSSSGSINTSSFAGKVDFTAGLDPYSVSIGDLDNDGKPDVVAANFNSSASVFNNVSTPGSILLAAKVDFDSGTGSLTVAINDLDGDGKPDLAFSNGGNRISVLKNKITSSPIDLTSFSFRVDFSASATPYGLAIGDLDSNGKPDIATANSGGTSASLLRNTVSSLPAFIGSSFTPNSGPVGTLVTFTGSNFSSTPLNNTVKFNGVVATVTAASSTSITAAVPAGATTGSVSIEVGCQTAITIFPFTITAGSTITITTQPSSASVCDGAQATITTAAMGTTAITYQWQIRQADLTFSDITDNSNYSGTATASLKVNTAGSFGAGNYRCRINGDFAAEVTTDIASLLLSPALPAPTTTGASTCVNGSATLTASGGADGQYRWYTVATGGTPVTGQVNNSYIISPVLVSTTYYVAINDGSCESQRTAVTATVISNGCEAAPVINTVALATQVEGKITLDLVPLITTSGTLAINSIQLGTQPLSGASASIINGILTIDYQGKKFSGYDSVTVQACNTNGACAQQTFSIEVAGDIIVYNAVSPNGDRKNDFLFLQYIDVLEETKKNSVSILNRWGSLVWEGDNYDNTSIVFDGKNKSGNDLPSGNYFYKIEFESGRKNKTGFFTLKR